jgi:hypothetical protein
VPPHWGCGIIMIPLPQGYINARKARIDSTLG